MALSIIAFVVAFVVTIVSTPFWIKKAKAIGLVGRDVHKKGRTRIAEAGGLAVIFSAVLGMLIYIFINIFIIKTQIGLIEMLAAILTLILAGFIGFIDDILGWKTGLKQIHKVILSIPIAIPLAVVNAGSLRVNSHRSLPEKSLMSFIFVVIKLSKSSPTKILSTLLIVCVTKPLHWTGLPTSG